MKKNSKKAAKGQGNYEVGKGKPPVEHQFKPGQSGNPKGMAKGHKNFRTRLLELAEKEIDYKDLGNNKQRMRAGDALTTALFAKAIFKGDTQAAKIILEQSDGKHLSISTNPLGDWLEAIGAKDAEDGDSKA